MTLDLDRVDQGLDDFPTIFESDRWACNTMYALVAELRAARPVIDAAEDVRMSGGSQLAMSALSTALAAYRKVIEETSTHG
jgi:hypothetical protein